jgi:hypothetical protein
MILFLGELDRLDKSGSTDPLESQQGKYNITTLCTLKTWSAEGHISTNVKLNHFATVKEMVNFASKSATRILNLVAPFGCLRLNIGRLGSNFLGICGQFSRLSLTLRHSVVRLSVQLFSWTATIDEHKDGAKAAQ